MTSKAAKSERLGELHSKVTEVMISTLDNIETTNQKLAALADLDPESAQHVPLEPSAALLGAVTKFLKDNEITCNDEAPQMQTLKGAAERKGKPPQVASPLLLENLPLEETTKQ